MQLVAIWVKGHYLFETCIFNFGGKYFYAIEEDKDGNQLIITRNYNEDYIPNFYTKNGGKAHIALINAIVGKNGAGKSTLLEVVRSSVHHNDAWGGFILYEQSVLIFEDGDSVIIRYKNLENENSAEAKYKIYCKNFLRLYTSKKIETIYYSPLFEAKELYFDSAELDIDISTDRLLHLSAGNRRYEEGFDIVWEYKYDNIYKQLSFLSADFSSFLYNELGIPKHEDVRVKFRGPEYASSSHHHTPYDFRPIIIKLEKIWREEIQKTQRQITRDIDENRKIVKLWFLKELFNCLFAPLEHSNDYLEEGVVYLDEDSFEDLNFKDSILYFLQNIKIEGLNDNYPPFIEVRKLIDYLFDIIDNMDSNQIRGTKEIRVSYEEIQKLLSLQRSITDKLSIFKPAPTGIMDVDPFIELSSGEKSMMDLFSRLYFSLDLIKEKYLNTDIGDYPNHLVLLIDEGELGFHPVWKKKYINTLINVLPDLFDKISLTFQVIFTTHDPLTLSEILNYNVVYLDKKEDKHFPLKFTDLNRPKQSFGANITNLISNSFFIDNGLVGDFAIYKIDETIAWLNNLERLDDYEYHRKIIRLIDEPLIKKKLSEMFTLKTGESTLEVEVLNEQIKRLEERKNQLKQR